MAWCLQATSHYLSQCWPRFMVSLGHNELRTYHWQGAKLGCLQQQENGRIFYFHELTLIPAWISNHMPSKMWDEIIHPFPNSNGCTVEVNGLVVWDTITYPFPNFNGVTIKVWERICNFIPQFIIDIIAYPCWKSQTNGRTNLNTHQLWNLGFPVSKHTLKVWMEALNER